MLLFWVFRADETFFLAESLLFFDFVDFLDFAVWTESTDLLPRSDFFDFETADLPLLSHDLTDFKDFLLLITFST